MLSQGDRRAFHNRSLDQSPMADRWHEELEEVFEHVAASESRADTTYGTSPESGATAAALKPHIDIGVGESEDFFDEDASAAVVQPAAETLVSSPARHESEPSVGTESPFERTPDQEIARLREEAARRIATTERMHHDALARRREADDRQSESWAAEQQRRFTERLDAMLAAEDAASSQRLANEKDRLSAWGQAEHLRIQGELASEEQEFHDRLLVQLEAFEFQLGERLREQEQRMGRWFAQAEGIVEQRTASQVAKLEGASRAR